MAEYINRGRAMFEAKRYFKNMDEIQEDLDMLFCMLPAADVAPVRPGRWLDGKCTVCGWEEPDVCTWMGYDSEAWIETPYCPNCGAIMDLEG